MAPADGTEYSKVRPAAFLIDQNDAWKWADWQVWDSTHAIARALVYGHDCDPTCADGHPWAQWGTVTLHRPILACDGRRYFGYVTYRLDHSSRIGGRTYTFDARHIIRVTCRENGTPPVNPCAPCLS